MDSVEDAGLSPDAGISILKKITNTGAISKRIIVIIGINNLDLVTNLVELKKLLTKHLMN